MTRHLHFDCFNGISGDMTLGALVDLGVNAAEIERRLSRLPIGEFHLRAEKTMRSGIAVTRLHVDVGEGEDHDHGHKDDHAHAHSHSTAHSHSHSPSHSHEHGHSHGHGGYGHDHGHSETHENHEHREHAHSHPHEHVRLADVLAKVESAGLGVLATRRASKAYRLLAEAEAHVHGTTPEKVHFHEVGAKDAIVDIAGAMVGVELLGAESFSTSAVVTGNGFVKCAHGVMPVPAPATAEILKGLPMGASTIQGEMTTPTGAAILKTLLSEQTDHHVPSSLMPLSIGYGAGSRVIEGHPNCLRLILGESSGATALPVEREEIVSIETEIDDMSAEVSGYVMERLFAAGARDVHFSPVQMKKNRPGQRLSVLCTPGDESRIAEIVFRETSTFGLRVQRPTRLCLRRRMESVRTSLGEVAVKVGLWGNSVLKVTPEFEACRALATSSGRPLTEVFALAQRAIQDRYFAAINKSGGTSGGSGVS